MRGAICEQKICSDSHEKICFLHLADRRELKIRLEINPLGFVAIMRHFQVPLVWHFCIPTCATALAGLRHACFHACSSARAPMRIVYLPKKPPSKTARWEGKQ